MITRCFIALGLLAAASSAIAQTPTYDATFTRKSDSREFGSAGPFYPSTAAREGIAGDAVIQCHYAAGGHLAGCEVVSESPQGLFFGVAALHMARLGAIIVTPDRPIPPGAPVRVHVPFQMGR